MSSPTGDAKPAWPADVELDVIEVPPGYPVRWTPHGLYVPKLPVAHQAATDG